MSVLSTLQNVSGCAGGEAIYAGAKASCLVLNAKRERRELWSNTRSVMQVHFPKLDLTKVRFCINCTLPGNWFASAKWVAAMTFGYTIYFDDSDVQKTHAGLRLLMHELVHVDQVRRLGGESAFACAYGKGYLSAGSYRQNALEVEAYDFVTKHGAALPASQANPG